MKIAIDLGHGVGQDRGAVGVIAEETIINTVGALVISKLKDLGHEVIEVRPIGELSVGQSLAARVQKADSNNVDLFVSLHANAGGGVGTEVFTYNAKEVPEARAVLNNIVALGFTDRGIKDGSKLYVVRNPSATAMLIEVCFVDTQSDVDLYNSIGTEAIANAIVNGLTGQVANNSKGYVVTTYLPNAYEGYDGIDINYVLSYFPGSRAYMKHNNKGMWIETQMLPIEKCNELKETLGYWFYSIEQ
ncbi:N-acetylmuramoyl-L-alanine amidase [Clostridium beijerinckii]|uniref:Sporulation-specific N-acetylmuramoyl-L-alanine amidase n=1 Tax=Clostridium beijerinckii TaxID=1520 RepID=A0A1S8S3C3_CLOBE|nr:N-acetylmuramoyl-L-alanine amidase [Clostridium beijerinckii]NRY60834.1 N-acetylmuramoyl-L-alanine amidase [Clostridium beijerinckii]OOM59939.1 sporulation-specific N-acetylmuramoyl-L-alanine amidase [Clostridium beijerinckii]